MNDIPQPSSSEIHLNKIKNRLFEVSPIISQGLDRECSKNDFAREDNELIDYGCLGKLWRVNHKKTDEVYGIKVMQKDKIKKSGQSLIDSINSVLKVMYTVRHPNVLMLLNHFEDEDNLYLIFQNEMLLKGNLSDQLAKITDEDKLLSLMKQIIIVTMYINSKESAILNRDIRPEYILLDEKLEIAKITDYVWSDLINFNRNSTNFENSLNCYTAPETINKWEITSKIDVWNLGVLFYEMLTGEKAFKGKSLEEQKDKILNCKIQWSGVKFPSEMSKNLVKSMLKLNPEERPSLNHILNNIIFQNHNVVLPSSLNKQIEDVEFIMNKKIYYKKNSTKHQDVLNEKLTKENEQLKSELERKKSEYTILDNEYNMIRSKLEKYEKESEIKDVDTISLNDDYIYFNQDEDIPNINSSEGFEKISDLEEQSHELLEYRSKVRLLEYESELLKLDYEEVKQKNEEYEIEIKKLNNLVEEERNEKYSKITILDSRIVMLENSIFSYPNNSKNSDLNFEEFCKNLCVIISNLLKEFKELVQKLIKKSSEVNGIIFKSFKEFLNEKEDNIKELIYKTKESFEKELRSKSLFKFSTDSVNGKIEKLDWMQKQINELMPYKMKSLNLKELLEKCEDKNRILNEKLSLMEIEIKTLKSIIAVQEDSLINLKSYVTNIEDKLSDTKDFIMKKCPDKIEEFFQIYNL